MSSIDSWHPVQPGQSHKPALDKARRDLASLAPRDMAMFSGVPYEEQTNETSHNGRFRVKLWEDEFLIHHPDATIQAVATGEEPRVSVQIILLHYLLTADGARPSGEWITFRELPGGNAYEGAFQQRANQLLARAFDKQADKIINEAQALGGTRLTFGDASFMFHSLPRLSMAVILYRGDDEFQAKANILFDGAADHYLPTEDLAVLGELLAERLSGERF